jgi:plasmid maintenance system antidote protein VapI
MSLLKRLFKRKLYSFEPDYVVRPSKSILEAMEFAGVSTISIWAKTQMQWATIAKLLADEIQIDELISTELSKVLGGAPVFWFNLSKNYHDRKGGKDA